MALRRTQQDSLALQSAKCQKPHVMLVCHTSSHACKSTMSSADGGAGRIDAFLFCLEPEVINDSPNDSKIPYKYSIQVVGSLLS